MMILEKWKQPQKVAGYLPTADSGKRCVNAKSYTHKTHVFLEISPVPLFFFLLKMLHRKFFRLPKLEKICRSNFE